LSNNNKTATKTIGTVTVTSVGTGWDSGVLGNSPCEKYSIRIINRGANGYLMVGLAPKTGFRPNGHNYNSCGFYLHVHGTLYGQDGTSGKAYRGSAIMNGSTIQVIYDKPNQQIRFKVDNQDYGVGFSNVTGDLYPAVEFYDLHASVKLL
jgi:hypothetical protein